MKKIALAAVLAATASTAFAGGTVEPIMEPVVVVEETSSSGGILVPLLVLLVVAVAIGAS